MMREKIDPDWWKKIFDQVYLITDARSVCDLDLTCREIDFLIEVLDLNESWAILDLCGGQGRHSLELSRRGFFDVTVLDFSRVLIELGTEAARKEGLKTRFIRGDARNTGLPGDKYKVIIIMASSFGYFEEERQNEGILREAHRLLGPEGRLLLDLPDRDHVLKALVPRSSHRAGEDITVYRERHVSDDIIYSREKVVSDEEGLIRDASYCTRLYRPEKIERLLRSAGFETVSIRRDFVSREEKEDYGLMTNRMIVISEK
ncbi:MAG: methyltransferase domain-containing protein [Pseudomonadota bacterium]